MGTMEDNLQLKFIGGCDSNQEIGFGKNLAAGTEFFNIVVESPL